VIRRIVTRRPRVAGVVAGAVAFLAAMLAGILWFSPDHSSAEVPPTHMPDIRSPRTTREPTDSPSGTPDPSSPSSLQTSMADRPKQETEQRQRGNRQGKHKEDEDDD
jgi:serine/threonine-protein kinase